jgi:hypothetical protein
MGDEYAIRYSNLDREKLAYLLAQSPYFCSIDETGMYNFRSPPARIDPKTWPDCTIKFEDYGVYVCQYGGKELKTITDDLLVRIRQVVPNAELEDLE